MSWTLCVTACVTVTGDHVGRLGETIGTATGIRGLIGAGFIAEVLASTVPVTASTCQTNLSHSAES